MNLSQVDIQENEIYKLSPDLLQMLLRDNTLSTPEQQVNIFWATDNYAERGDGYQYYDKISMEAITGENGNVIVPRALKSRELQKKRSRKMAEIFTPSWICNEMVSLIDEAWFKRKDVFNTPVSNPGYKNTWIVNTEKITFPEGKTWLEYVSDNRLEITCGEAPFLMSRYDTVSGEYIPVERRIGILDRKLRVVDENTVTKEEWMEAATLAIKGTYGYEWQGDSLLLARETMLFTMMDYYRYKFNEELNLEQLMLFAEIASWNLWQMDGLKFVIPNSCEVMPRTVSSAPSLFDGFEDELEPVTQPTIFDCPGCKTGDSHAHIGIYTLIMDWGQNKPIQFVSLLSKKENGARKKRGTNRRHN